jgi:hypothetical protein
MVAFTDRSRPVASPLFEMPPARRDRIARAVHRVAGSVIAPFGGKCGYYTMAGAAILMHLGHEVMSQFGSMVLHPDPADPTLMFAIDAESPGALDRGEYHGWIVSPEGVFIDFSARDWSKMVEGVNMGRLSAADAALAPATAFGGEATDEVMRWNRPPLDYLWCAWNDMPDYVRFRLAAEAIVLQRRRFHEAHGEVFIRMAIRTYEELEG